MLNLNGTHIGLQLYQASEMFWPLSPPTSVDFKLSGYPEEPQCGAGDQDKAAMHFLSFDCLSAEEREIVDLRREVKDLMLNWKGFILSEKNQKSIRSSQNFL